SASSRGCGARSGTATSRGRRSATRGVMANQPEQIQTEDLVPRFEERFEEELARGTSRGRAALVAFVDVAAADFGDRSFAAPNDVLQCEIDSDEQQVVVGLIRSMARSVGSASLTNLNLQVSFQRPPEEPAEYSVIELGDEGAETPAKLLEWVSSHP